jgi:Zn-dependent membrane protease YugP
MLVMGFRLGGLILVGVACHGLVALFQLVTLPVEFDASRRARRILAEM